MRPNGRFASTLQIAAAVAAVIAVLQQNNGVRFGIGMVAVLLLLGGISLALHRRSQRTRRLSRTQRRDVTRYFNRVVQEFERELPLPVAEKSGSLAQDVRHRAAYVSPPFRVYASGLSRELTQPEIDVGTLDSVQFATERLDKGESLTLIGGPGSGKTLLGVLIFATLADNYISSRGREPLPVFVRLNTLGARDGGTTRDPLEDVLALLPEPIRSIETTRLHRMLNEARICFVLDGLDEIPSTLGASRSAKRIPPEVTSILGHAHLITCREAFHDLYVDGDNATQNADYEIHLLPLEYDKQVSPFVQQYCRAMRRPDLCAPMLTALTSNERLAETLSRPLMLRMTVHVLLYELQRDEKSLASRILLTGSDYFNAEIYDRYIVAWLKREQGKASRPVLRPSDKLSLVESIAWKIFCNPMRRDAGYGSFELTDLLIARQDLLAVIRDWIARQPQELAESWSLADIFSEIEERTFLIMSERADTYRFAHKSFFEYLLARHVYDCLARPIVTEDVVALLTTPFPDEVIDFLRELLHWCKARAGDHTGAFGVEEALLKVLRDDDDSNTTIMARQQAANLLPIVATADTRTYLKTRIAPNQHPFIRRAIAVGEALHHADASLLDEFVNELDVDPIARSFHMGYNRIYYGDQPLSSTNFQDDGGADCTRFFRACTRHIELERYRYIKTMALATVRLMLNDPARRALLVEQERPALMRLLLACNREDERLGQAYDRERSALAEVIRSGLDGLPDSLTIDVSTD